MGIFSVYADMLVRFAIQVEGSKLMYVVVSCSQTTFHASYFVYLSVEKQ